MNLPAMIFRYEPNSVGLAALTGLAEMAFARTASARQVRLAERVKRNLHAASVTRG
jgi:hypothetical protein